MDGISNVTMKVIEKLGYLNSDNFYYYQDLLTCSELSFHDRKVIMEIRPNAFFLADGRPKVLFFEYVDDENERRELHKKIWNAQIPIIIFTDFNCIKIFSGINMKICKLDDYSLLKIGENEISECNELSAFSYWSITNEQFLRQYQSKFYISTLNEVMIDNIKYITNKLKNVYSVSFATRIILRMIFIRFLIDRGINIGYDGFCGDINKDKQLLLEITLNKKRLYQLFAYLKVKFNGNLFELNDEMDDSSLTDEVLISLECFLSGKEEMTTGQLSFFPIYDFNIIPVELISNIYEILLGDKTQKSDKAFYTPEYLADYIIKETVGIFLTTAKQCKVLDPSCGSGIFLVEALRQIMDKNVDNDGYIKDNQKLRNLVENNIYGVDLNPEAIDITIFSLYLTLFDYKDPKSLEGFKLPDLKSKNLFVCDFFNDQKLYKISNIKFDFIIGNPPWGAVKKGLHINYCNKNNIEIQRYEISRSFIAKVKDYCGQKTICALIIPSKIFYNKELPAINFRKRLLKNCKIIKFIELSSVRNLIFEKADAPAVILIFKHTEKNNLDNNMIHISLKPNMFFKLYHIIAAEKADIKRISQRVLYENDWAWKTCVYGTAWDIDNIKYLKKKYVTLNDFFKKNQLETTAGISDNPGEFDASCYMGRDIIESSAVNTFYYDSNQKNKFSKSSIYRLGKTELYNPPYCLIRKGPDCHSYRLRAAFVNDDVIFKQAIFAIKGKSNQRDLLLNIIGILNSSLYIYLNLMQGSSMGVEREQVFMNEIYQYPFFLDEDISRLADTIQRKNSKLENGLIQDTSAELEELDRLVLKDFGLDDDPFVDYAINVQIPMLNKNKWYFNEVTKEQLMEYAMFFYNYWKPLMADEGKFIELFIYPKVKSKFSIFELNITNHIPDNEISIVEDIDNNKELLTRFVINKINNKFYEVRDVLHFTESSFYIVKSNEYKNWHIAMAHMDNATVVSSILSESGVEL
jgi:hypothetical protein